MTSLSQTINSYYVLAKPGMVYANTFAAAAGFAFAAGAIDWPVFAALVGGIFAVIASACVFNNIYDRAIDMRMERTKSRPIPMGHIRPAAAMWYGVALLLIGVGLLSLTNPLALTAGLMGFVVYVMLYTPLKPRSPYALYVGAVAGAMPPVAGYLAVTPVLDWWVAFLFGFMFLWQLPHFLAIAVYRHEEYAAAGVPMFMRGPYTDKQKKLARKIFWASLVVLMLWCLVLFVA
jgi:heme o synthase